ncbi:MAG: ribosome biogenesis GTPase Der, partial [Acidimicrobiales bacterium]
MDQKVSAQAETAMGQAGLVLFVVDGMVGMTEEDEAVARTLRRAGGPVLLVVNKVDSQAQEADAWAFSRLGMGDVWMVSALHGRGMGDLLDDVVCRLRRRRDEKPGPMGDSQGREASFPSAMDAGCPSVALVGRPNVGKSTLFNRLIGDERSITHELPGTTRDAVDTVVETEEGKLRFIDTAGMRRKSRMERGTEYYSLVRALQAIDKADVALLLIDATEGVTHQDQRLAERVDAAGSPAVVVLNKWELLAAPERADVITDIEDRLGFLGYSPVVKLSALTGKGVHRLLPAVAEAFAAYHRRLPTREVNQAVQAAQAAHAAPGGRILYAVQG